jgi:chemotaxis protein CheX
MTLCGRTVAVPKGDFSGAKFAVPRASLTKPRLLSGDEAKLVAVAIGQPAPPMPAPGDELAGESGLEFAEGESCMTSTGGNGVAPVETWREVLCKATVEVFTMMVGSEVVASQNAGSPLLPNVTGTVGIAGAISAIFSLRCSAQSAIQIASHMLGVSTDDAGAQKCDAIGEICNMVAGHFKAKIGLGDKCMLSVPTVITGGDYRIHPLAGGERLELPLLYEGEPISITLDIRR